VLPADSVPADIRVVRVGIRAGAGRDAPSILAVVAMAALRQKSRVLAMS
jgi:hypothetical protein